MNKAVRTTVTVKTSLRKLLATIWPLQNCRSSWKGEGRRRKKPRQYDTSKLKDPITESPFQALLSNRLSALAELTPGATEWWDRLKDAISAAKEEILGFKQPLKESWISDQTWALITERKNSTRKSKPTKQYTTMSTSRKTQRWSKVLREPRENGWRSKMQKQQGTMTCERSTRSQRRSWVLPEQAPGQ